MIISYKLRIINACYSIKQNKTVAMKMGAPDIDLDSSSTTADSLFGCSIMNQTEKMERICSNSIY